MSGRARAPLPGVTAGVVPGAMPVAVRLTLDGGAASWAEERVRPRRAGPGWALVRSERLSPVYGTVSFGRSGPLGPASDGGGPVRIPVSVLEDGSRVAAAVPLSRLAPGGPSPALLERFALSPGPAAAARVDAGASRAVWDAPGLDGAAPPGSVRRREAVPPRGFAAGGVRVVLDRGRARLFVHLPELGAHVPPMPSCARKGAARHSAGELTALAPTGPAPFVFPGPLARGAK